VNLVFKLVQLLLDEEMLCKCFDKCSKALAQDIPANLVPAAAVKQVVETLYRSD